MAVFHVDEREPRFARQDGGRDEVVDQACQFLVAQHGRVVGNSEATIENRMTIGDAWGRSGFRRPRVTA